MTAALSPDEQLGLLLDEVETGGAPKAELPVFFLHSLEVANFRSIEKATFSFQPGLNVIIGANNAAKTAVVDALRVVFGLGTFENREDSLRLRYTDVFSDGTDAKARAITFTAQFYGETDSELPAQFYDLLCPDDTVKLGPSETGYTAFKLRYRVEFEVDPATGRYAYVRNDLRGGPDLTNPVAHEALDFIRAIYLAPLRDLVNERARVGAEIERLILSHTQEGKEAERGGIPDELRTLALERIAAVTGNQHEIAAGENLAEYARPYNIGRGSLSFVPTGISEDLFRAMEPVFAHALHGGPGGLPLRSNGLGINQLIYASIVLSRRGNTAVGRQVRKFFLIEEPEAHLHPQLQDSFFAALNRITDHQIFVTSHSPTITAKTDLDKIIVMRRDAGNRTARPLHLAEVFKDRPADKKYLHKFLDVTRSQLLFAQGAIFVEGVTEAMLMQRFSEIAGCSLRDHGIEVVSVESSRGFDHFRPLFENGEDTYCRAAFITDGDEKPEDVATDETIKADTGSALDRGLEAESNSSTATATGYGTFEFGLLRAAVVTGAKPGMYKLLADAMAASAPPPVVSTGRQAAFVRDFLDKDRPSQSYKKMKANSTKNTFLSEGDWYAGWRTNSYFLAAKSDFAFYLNEALCALPLAEAAERLTVPKYMRDAFDFVVNATGKGSDSGTD